MLMGRLTSKLGQLTKIYQDIMDLVFENSPENVLEEFKLFHIIGNKVGTFFRIAINFEI